MKKFRCDPPKIDNANQVSGACTEIKLKWELQREKGLDLHTIFEGETCTPQCKKGYHDSRDGQPVFCSQNGWVESKRNWQTQLYEPVWATNLGWQPFRFRRRENPYFSLHRRTFRTVVLLLDTL